MSSEEVSNSDTTTPMDTQDSIEASTSSSSSSSSSSTSTPLKVTKVSSALIKEKDNVLLIANETDYSLVQIHAGRKVRVSKRLCLMDGLIGQPYGSTFEAVVSGDSTEETQQKADSKKRQKKERLDCKFVLLDDERATALTQLIQASVGEETDADNRNLVDDSSAQKLAQEEIEKLKQQGKGDALLQALVENSASFQSKTVFSKEKYLKKKQKKHILLVRVLRPTARLVCKTYFSKGDTRLGGLREDSLAQLLTLSNVGPRTTPRVLVVETSSGMLLGAVAERMGGFGDIVELFIGRDTPLTPMLQHFNFPREVTDSIHHYPFSKLQEALTKIDGVAPNHTEGEGKPTERKDRYASTVQYLEPESFDCVLIATKYAPQRLLMNLWPLLAPSRSFAIFHQYVQPLADCHQYLGNQKLALDLSLREIWLREFQVLPKRTHPQMWMHDASGYILSGIKVVGEPSKQSQSSSSSSTSSSQAT